jgi:hypothetical protein
LESLFLTNLASPPLLFFFLGAAAALLRSDLEIPAQVAKFLSLYLLFAIGFKGGVALSESTLDASVISVLAAAVGLACVVPVYAFYLLRLKLGAPDAAAIAATYGSISAVTFVTGTSYVDTQGLSWNGYLVAAMALMESPAIVIGILLYRLHGGQAGVATVAHGDGGDGRVDWGSLGREAFLNGSVFLILGSMLVGWFTGSAGMDQVKSVVKDPFIGLLCLFLLDMGIVAARRLGQLSRSAGAAGGQLPFLLGFALLVPLANAVLGAVIGWQLGLGEGDALLLTILAASASYIAVPAAMRLALPEANPSLYLPMSLAVTFPFNLLIGIPLYHQLVIWLLSS